MAKCLGGSVSGSLASPPNTAARFAASTVRVASACTATGVYGASGAITSYPASLGTSPSPGPAQTTTGVITYRDGVATFPGYLQEEPYYDIANIQVLRGPQGTIVGQNATGGAVFVNTNDPVIGGGVHGF